MDACPASLRGRAVSTCLYLLIGLSEKGIRVREEEEKKEVSSRRHYFHIPSNTLSPREPILFLRPHGCSGVDPTPWLQWATWAGWALVWGFDYTTKNKVLPFCCGFCKKDINLQPQEPLPRESLHENEVKPEESRTEQWRVQVPKQPLSLWIQPYLKPNSTSDIYSAMRLP